MQAETTAMHVIENGRNDLYLTLITITIPREIKKRLRCQRMYKRKSVPKRIRCVRKR